MRNGAQGRVAIVTGAAGGLGGATGRRLAADGFSVVLSDMHAGRAEALADELGGLFVLADVTQEDQVAALVDAAMAHHGRLDVMVNNAGVIGAKGSITQMAAADWSRTMAILLDSVMFGMKHAARAMIAGGRGGAILSTSSVAALRTIGPHPYVVAKSAVVALTRSVATELASQRIRVNAVAPGYVPTPMTAQSYGGDNAARDRIADITPMPDVVEADDIAGAFSYLASDDARHVTGQLLVVDGGFTTCDSPASRYQVEPDFIGSATL